MNKSRFLFLILLVSAFGFGGSAFYVLQKDQDDMKEVSELEVFEKRDVVKPIQSDQTQQVENADKLVEKIVNRVNEPWSAIQSKVNNTVVQTVK